MRRWGNDRCSKERSTPVGGVDVWGGRCGVCVFGGGGGGGGVCVWVVHLGDEDEDGEAGVADPRVAAGDGAGLRRG